MIACFIARVGRHISVGWFSRRDIAAIGERGGLNALGESPLPGREGFASEA